MAKHGKPVWLRSKRLINDKLVPKENACREWDAENRKFLKHLSQEIVE